MIGRVLILLAVGANVAAAAVTVTGSAWLWERAGEPVVRPEPIPTLPPIVDETSVPLDHKAARLWPARSRVARRPTSHRPAKKAALRRTVRRALISKRTPSAVPGPTTEKARAVPAAKRTVRPKTRKQKHGRGPVKRRVKPIRAHPAPAPPPARPAPTPAPPAPQPIQPSPAPQPVTPPPEQPVEREADTGWKSKKPKKEKKPKKPKKDHATKPKHDQWAREEPDGEAEHLDDEGDQGRSDDREDGDGKHGHGNGHRKGKGDGG